MAVGLGLGRSACRNKTKPQPLRDRLKAYKKDMAAKVAEKSQKVKTDFAEIMED